MTECTLCIIFNFLINGHWGSRQYHW